MASTDRVKKKDGTVRCLRGAVGRSTMSLARMHTASHGTTLDTTAGITMD